MIIRKNSHRLIMIEQHNHALLSAKAMEKWGDNRLWHDPLVVSVLYAIKNHDRGWYMFDKQPFWNDAINSVYAFTDFPILAKTVLYRNGVDEVEAEDPYAALLCSEYYCKFMIENDKEEAQQFVQEELKRQQRIMKSMPMFDKERFAWHYELLNFADNLSLYICLNEPGASKSDEHPFFQEGISADRSIVGTTEDKVQAHWSDEHTIALTPFPFTTAFDIIVPFKCISREVIAEHGLVKSYEAAETKRKTVTLPSSV